ncbi:hypothetical protein CS562_14130 [Paenibacillus sp. LK1]|nr:hypothetical protein CS562_14130 [Paenibacillus sp. LK1]
MYKKYWVENGTRYLMKVRQSRVSTGRMGGVELYTTEYNLSIFKKMKYWFGWKSVYKNKLDSDYGISLESFKKECINDFFGR